jgi:DNA-binding winged helix-turn-helix (wHTH) protein
MDGYLINESLVFWPERNCLISLLNPSFSHVLPKPASRCLLILLQRYPEIVPQDDFFNEVWTPEKMIVPLNTLYQNISLIRRGIKAVSGDENRIITTVPKKGFQIKVGTSVQLIAEDFIPNGTVDSLTAVDAPGPASVTEKKLKFNTVFYFLMCLLIFTCAFVYYLVNFDDEEMKKNIFDEYNIVEDSDGCHFLRTKASLSKGDILPIQGLNLDCKEYPWVYLTHYNNAQTTTMISCDRPLTDRRVKSSCVSIIFRETKK